MGHPRILLVEDEHNLAQLMIDYLQKDGMEAHHLDDGRGVVDRVIENAPDLILLDVSLPGKNGFTICREIRKFSDVPIIMITARIGESDRLAGLELGADDYICKPFSPREVVARVKAVLRRRPEHMSLIEPDIRLDRATNSVSYHGNRIELTAVEFQLLETLLKIPGRIFSRDELMDRVYDDHRIVNDRTIDSHVKKLRRKLETIMPNTKTIQAVYGLGYKLILTER